MWCKMLNSGVNHDHLKRIISSKISNSENTAPKYFMFKDHKIEGGYRPVVGGCSSDTLGLSNTLSEVVESVAKAIDDPFEVISSEDLLSRIYKCNSEIEKLKPCEKMLPENSEPVTLEEAFRQFWDRIEEEENWRWYKDYIILGSDVCSLFPSLTADRTSKAVRNQIEKSKIEWSSVDWRLVSLYIKLNEDFWEKDKSFDQIRGFLPRRKSRYGRPPSLATDKVEEKFEWPSSIDIIGRKTKAILMGLAMQRAVYFFFKNFMYHFGGDTYVQMEGGQ